ncbi:AraC family transcriptional regulator [Parabacteroides distasonis]
MIASSKSFADIAMQYNLSSQAYLSTFCKRFYEKTPQEIRNSSL